MNKTVILRLAGLLLGPLLIMVIGAYFLYPVLNPAKYNQVVEKFDREKLPDSSDGFQIGNDFQTLIEQVKLFKGKNKQLQTVIDSLKSVNMELTQKLEEEAKQDSIARINEAQKLTEEGISGQANLFDKAAASGEDFADKVKGLLGLDEEDLSPIVNKMSDNQLFRLYREGNTIQRKKLLRSLESERAAKLMSRVML